MDYLEKLEEAAKTHHLSKKMVDTLRIFYLSYKEAIEANGNKIETLLPTIKQFLAFILEQLEHPYIFEPYHEAIRKPVDYYQFGLNFFRPLVLFSSSQILNEQILEKIQQQLAEKENVVLLANHQTEPDPQAISLLLESKHPDLAEKMIFVAGHRVTSDPLSVPFSKGRNLLCIHSKKHIENPPELKQEKLIHNKRTMKRMSELLSEGGKCIYVAPSGGRDRANVNGEVEVAKFDPQSIEMFWLMAQKANRPTHFYGLALSTYKLLPPPQSVEIELGESRHARCSPIHMGFSDEIEMDHFASSEGLDKKQKKIARAEFIWNLVNSIYQKLN